MMLTPHNQSTTSQSNTSSRYSHKYEYERETIEEDGKTIFYFKIKFSLNNVNFLYSILTENFNFKLINAICL